MPMRLSGRPQDHGATFAPSFSNWDQTTRRDSGIRRNPDIIAGTTAAIAILASPGTQIGIACTSRGLKVRTKPVGPDTSCPCIAVKHAQGEDAPLSSFPSSVEPKRLTEHPKDARPPAPVIALVLREPDRDDAAKGNADLI